MRLRITLGLPAAAGILALSALAGTAAVAAPASAGTPAAGVLPAAPPAAIAVPPAAATGAAAAREACPPPASYLTEQCQLLVAAARPGQPVTPAIEVSPGTVNGPLNPAELRSAYGLASASAASGTGVTVAVVDAFHDPYVAADLARFRQLNSLGNCSPPAGTSCLAILNQRGQASPLPAATDAGWEDETALDVEMIAAICPKCRIALLEASSAGLGDLGTAENSAAGLARFISNSWSGPDFPGESSYDSAYFNHPGVAITVASGDYRYGAGYPASSQLVTSVGGTYLNASSLARGWSEVAWSGQSTGGGTGTESGCSAGEPKPAWQADAGCANRTENDVAAVADAPQGVEFYSSARDCGGVCQAYGTSVATPVIAATYALAGTPRPGTYPAQYPYLTPSALHRVTSGANGTCEASRQYACDAARSLASGYNGPDGLGTPSGTAAFAAPASAAHRVSVVSPGLYDLQAGLYYALPPIQAIDSAAGQRITFSASGLPAGLSVNAATGVISGIPPSGKTTSATVHVTAADLSGASTTIIFRIVAVNSLAGAYRAGSGEASLNLPAPGGGSLCLDDRGNQTRQGSPVQAWRCLNDQAQHWTFRPGGAPGAPGAIMVNGRCLDITGRATTAGSPVAVWPCTGYGNQQWLITGGEGEIYNPASGMCLDYPGGARVNGRQADIQPCQGAARQAWTLPASPVQSGVAGKCLNDLGGQHANGARVAVWTCDGTAAGRFTLGLDGSVRIGGKCLNIVGASGNDGTGVQLYTCTGAANEIFRISAFGTLQNLRSGKCLADPGDSTANGTQVVIEDCYGLPGEIWAAT
ncbi:MAG TPA: ricin-type beta-trefoil lectin domain protein [Trebonia sp.]|nr:ricin-type beta-trefoil lectin domain protein [Trebonia sp.]